MFESSILLVHVKSLTHNSSFSFPESEGDDLLIEVQDKKKSVQGKATIPMASLTENPVNMPLGVLPLVKCSLPFWFWEYVI